MSLRLVHYSDLETVYDTPERAARLAGCLRELDGPDALLAGSGDDTGPGVLSLVSDGRQALDLFRAVEPDVETVGNHDLDHGPNALLDIVGASPQSWVLANVERGGAPFGADCGIDRWTTVGVRGTTIDDGRTTLGVTGVVDPATPEMTPGLDDLDFLDPLAAVDSAVSALGDAGATTVVVLAHTDTATAESVARHPGVDAVLAGHEHDPRLGRVDGTPLSRPGVTGHRVFELDLGTGRMVRHDPADFRPHEGVRRTLEKRKRTAGLGGVIAEADRTLSRGRDRRTGGEWRLGNFVADAYRWATGADVGLQNTGGIRDGPPIGGDVTRGDLVGLCPFDEPVVVAELAGDQFVAVAHEADGRRLPGLPDYWLGHVSGMTIARDGDRGFEVRVGGDPVNPRGTYTVATPRYLLVTDREFPTLETEMAVRTADVQYEVIVDYAREEGIDPSLEGRIPNGV